MTRKPHAEMAWTAEKSETRPQLIDPTRILPPEYSLKISSSFSSLSFLQFCLGKFFTTLLDTFPNLQLDPIDLP